MFILLTEDAELNSGGAMNLVENFLPLVMMIVVVVASCFIAKILLNKWINELKNIQEEKFNEIVKKSNLIQGCNRNINEKCKSCKEGTAFSSVDYRNAIDYINNFYSSLDLDKIESSYYGASNDILDYLYERVKYLRYSINSFNVTSTVFEAVLISCIFWVISLFSLSISNFEVAGYIFATAFVAVFILVFCLHSWMEIKNNNNPNQLMKEYELSLLNKKIEEYYKSFDSYKKIKWKNPDEVKLSLDPNNLPQMDSPLTSGQPSEMPGSESGDEPDAVSGQPGEMKRSVNDDKLKDQTAKSISKNNTESDVKNANDEDRAKS